MKLLLSLTLLLIFCISNAQDLLKGKFDSIKECSNSKLTLVYKKKKTAVYWEKNILFEPSKNFYYYFERSDVLGEVNYDTKEVFYTVFDKSTGTFKKYKNDTLFLSDRNIYGSPVFSDDNDSEAIKQASLVFRNSLREFNIEVFYDKISITDAIDYSDPDKFEEKIRYKSGIFDIHTYKWIIPSGIRMLQQIGDKLLVGTIIDGNKIYTVYETKKKKPLNKIDYFKEENSNKIAKLYKADSAILNDKYNNDGVNSYHIYKDNKVGIISSSLFYDGYQMGSIETQVPIAFESIIPLTSNNDFLTLKDGEFSLYTLDMDTPTMLVVDSAYTNRTSRVKRIIDDYYGNFYNVAESYGTSSFRMDIVNDSLLFIIDNQLEEMFEYINNDGEFEYDEDGEQIYEISFGAFKSGLFNTKTNNWIVPNNHYEIYYWNDLVIATKPRFRDDSKIRNGTYSFDIYDLNGTLIKKNVTEANADILQLFYPSSSITKLGNNEYQIKNDRGSIWIEFSFSSGSIYYGDNIDRDFTEWTFDIKHQSPHTSAYLTNNKLILEANSAGGVSLSYLDNKSNKSVLINENFQTNFYFQKKQEKHNLYKQKGTFKTEESINLEQWFESFENLYPAYKNLENSYFSYTKISNDLVVINDHSLSHRTEFLDDYDDPIFDENGYMMYEQIGGNYFSGIMNIKNLEWLYQSNRGEIKLDTAGNLALIEYSLNIDSSLRFDNPTYHSFKGRNDIKTVESNPKSNLFDNYTSLPRMKDSIEKVIKLIHNAYQVNIYPNEIIIDFTNLSKSSSLELNSKENNFEYFLFTSKANQQNPEVILATIIKEDTNYYLIPNKASGSIEYIDRKKLADLRTYYFKSHTIKRTNNLVTVNGRYEKFTSRTWRKHSNESAIWNLEEGSWIRKTDYQYVITKYDIFYVFLTPGYLEYQSIYNEDTGITSEKIIKEDKARYSLIDSNYRTLNFTQSGPYYDIERFEFGYALQNSFGYSFFINLKGEEKSEAKFHTFVLEGDLLYGVKHKKYVLIDGIKMYTKEGELFDEEDSKRTLIKNWK